MNPPMTIIPTTKDMLTFHKPIHAVNINPVTPKTIDSSGKGNPIKIKVKKTNMAINNEKVGFPTLNNSWPNV